MNINNIFSSIKTKILAIDFSNREPKDEVHPSIGLLLEDIDADNLQKRINAGEKLYIMRKRSS